MRVGISCYSNLIITVNAAFKLQEVKSACLVLYHFKKCKIHVQMCGSRKIFQGEGSNAYLSLSGGGGGRHTFGKFIM